MRVVSTRVLPLPAPARISADACGSVTAASCSGLRFSRSLEDIGTAGERRMIAERPHPSGRAAAACAPAPSATPPRGYNRAHSLRDAHAHPSVRRPARRELRDDALVRASHPLGRALRPRVPRQDVRHRLRRRGGGRRRVPGRDPRSQPAAQPRHPPRRGARLSPADRGHPRRAAHPEPLRQRRARDRHGCDGLRARSRGPGARAHRGAALARPRQLADGGRAQPRVDGQLPHRQADGRRRRHGHAALRRGAPRRHRGDPAAPGRRRHRADLADRLFAHGRDLQPHRRGSRHAGRGAPRGRPSSSS